MSDCRICSTVLTSHTPTQSRSSSSSWAVLCAIFPRYWEKDWNCSSGAYRTSGQADVT